MLLKLIKINRTCVVFENDKGEKVRFNLTEDYIRNQFREGIDTFWDVTKDGRYAYFEKSKYNSFN